MFTFFFLHSITDFMDFNVLLNESQLIPVCDINFELSEVTLNHFEVSFLVLVLIVDVL